MVPPLAGAADDVPARPINQQAITRRLDRRQLRADPLPQAIAFAELLRINTAHDLLGPIHQSVELIIRPNIELAKSVKELGQVSDCTISEDLGLAIVCTGQAFGKV
jgi:hypothetical protein